MNAVSIRVPATTANLACGFDTLGAALALYNTLEFSLSDTLSFSGCDEEFQNRDNLAFQAFEAVYSHIGRAVPNVHIDIKADIPVCRGLGSSAAMLAAGAAAANALSGAGLSRAELLAVVTPIEGHPDNLAPAFFGGMTASLMKGAEVFTSRLPLHPELRFVVLSPDYTLSTHAARAVLPKNPPFADAVFNLSRLALLPKALEEGDEELIAVCLDDRLHQPYRSPLIPGMEDIVSLAAANGCRAVCISGAGPSLLCLTRDASLAGKMRPALKQLPHNWELRELKPDTAGATVTEK